MKINETFTVPLYWNELGRNGRIYSSEMIEQSMKQLQSHKPFLITIDGEITTAYAEITDTAGNDSVMVKFLDTPMGRFHALTFDNPLTLRATPRGTGIINDDGTISEFHLTGFDLFPKDVDLSFDKEKNK